MDDMGRDVDRVWVICLRASRALPCGSACGSHARGCGCGALAPSGYLWFGAHFLACATGAVARAKRGDEGRRSV